MAQSLSVAAVVNAYGTGCGGLLLAADGPPTIGNAGFTAVLANGPAVSPMLGA